MSLGPASCASVHHGWPAGTGEIPGERLGWGVRHPQGHTQGEAYRIRTCGRPIGTRIEGATDERRRCHPGCCPDGQGAATESWIILYRHRWVPEVTQDSLQPTSTSTVWTESVPGPTRHASPVTVERRL